jgi:hypothetical protein
MLFTDDVTYRFQILRYTDEDHPDHTSLTNALRTSELVLANTNEAIRAHENEHKLIILSRLELSSFDVRLDLTSNTRFGQKRLLLKEGEVQKYKSRKNLTIYLFNDLLLLTEVKEGKEGVYRLVNFLFLW